MELSGLIFVALALVWAIVLIPMALRHHDEVAKTRAVDRFSDDMRVLARREAVSEREARLVVEERGKVEHPPPAVEQRAEPAPVETTPPTRGPRALQAQRRAAAAAAKRRRHILLFLLLAGVVVAAGVPLGWFLPWAPAIPVAVTVLFLVVARVTVRREQRRGARAREAARASRQEAAGADVVPPAVREPAPVEGAPAPAPAPAVAERNEQGLAVVSGLDDTSSFPLGLVGSMEPTTDAGALWDPLPMTLPTYVTKPRANRSVRTIDLAASGVSSSGRDAADSALVAEAATSRTEAEEARKAVGS